MPRKVRPPANAVQNRENQQRSRARRREHLASLEARVRDFESREVQATLAMQRAAQEVAWVNERLMELLAARGVAREEVDEFLRQAGKDEDGTAGWRYAWDAHHGSGSRGGSVGLGGAGSCRGFETEKEGGHGRHDPREPGANGRNIADTGIGASGRAVDEHRMNVCDGVFQTPKPIAGNTDEGPPALVTSCDDAASIIADFQGHGDVSHARKVLGCGDVANCHVKNTRLFQLMDEAGGP
ncbi:hypothetical protein F4801DRAFT_580145 [Xylaria longipes]|nr:hypothetical protein F4801DRAFT_580145 [Xylaria longipes]